jgi:hypothetical protein
MHSYKQIIQSGWNSDACIIVGNRNLNDFVGSAHREETMCRILG